MIVIGWISGKVLGHQVSPGVDWFYFNTGIPPRGVDNTTGRVDSC